MAEKLLNFFVQYARINLLTAFVITYLLPQIALEFAAFHGRIDMVEMMMMRPRYYPEVADSVRLSILYGHEDCARVLLNHITHPSHDIKMQWIQDVLGSNNQNIRMLIYKSIYNL